MKTLSPRALNRAFLARQFLLERQDRTAYDTIKHLVGMQSQAPMPPYTGLWTRLRDFQPDELADLITGRKVVRIVTMRGTVHLLTADDALTLRPLLQPVLDRAFTGNPMGKLIAGLDRDAVRAAGRELLADRPMTPGELGAALQERWADYDPDTLYRIVHYLEPLVQVPPRGVWGKSGRTTVTTADTWLGEPLRDNGSLDDLVLRYLAAFGPASVLDVQAWCGLTRLGEVVDRLRPRLAVFADDTGRELFDLPDAPRPDPATTVPVRFLPEFDNALLSHADRRRIISDDDRKQVFTINGIIKGTVLVDGFVHAIWKLVKQRSEATITITPLRPLSTKDAEAVVVEGGRLLRFAATTAKDHQVVIEEP